MPDTAAPGTLLPEPEADFDSKAAVSRIQKAAGKYGMSAIRNLLTAGEVTLNSNILRASPAELAELLRRIEQHHGEI